MKDPNPLRWQDFLDEKVDQYNNSAFIESDPIQIPHAFSTKEDQEIAGFLAATLAWGNRKMIIKNAKQLLERMDNAPHSYVMGAAENDLLQLHTFVHRTFNGIDAKTFVFGLRHCYTVHGGMEAIFTKYAAADNLQTAINQFRTCFFEINHEKRTQKHISDPLSGSAAKRINMFLRWMVRNDNRGVDLGLWKNISPAALSCPLDVHSGRVARKLDLLLRSQNDARAVKELDLNLRLLDPSDPVKYDFALFGLGVFEGF
ncbi:MAG: TIGR02757 family protein [Flavobacterium sp. BFFFF2]|nr:MAG: TIGR02757 family protein [Flavobacterium sp. BFFFF2]